MGVTADCRFCAKAYLSDDRVHETACLNHISVMCSVPRDHPYPQVASFMGVTERPCAERCKAFEELAGPPRVWPPLTSQMKKDGLFWTDVTPADDTQRTLEEWL